MAFPVSRLRHSRVLFSSLFQHARVNSSPFAQHACKVPTSQRSMCYNTSNVDIVAPGVPTPQRSMCYDARKVDIAAAKTTYTFDTHQLIQYLTEAGYDMKQAEAMKNVLVQITTASQEHQNKHMVTKPEQEIMVQQIMTHIGSVRKDMIILEKSEFSQLKHEYEKQHIEITQLKQTLQDEIQKLRSSVTLDLNLERSRSKEDHGVNQGLLSGLENKIEIHNTELEKDMSQLDSKIDKEIANLLATYERYRNDIMKYAGGTVMTCLTICLGFYRLWS